MAPADTVSGGCLCGAVRYEIDFSGPSGWPPRVRPEWPPNICKEISLMNEQQDTHMPMHPMPETERRPNSPLDRHHTLARHLVLALPTHREDRLAIRFTIIHRIFRQCGEIPRVLQDVRVAADVARREGTG